MTDTFEPTVADLIPVRARQWVYALLVPANAGLAAAIAAGSDPKVYAIALAVVNALGFSVSRGYAGR